MSTNTKSDRALAAFSPTEPNGWLRRHAGEGRLQASQALRAGREGRKLPVEGEGSSADGRGTGRVHDKRGAKRSGCVSAGIPRIDPDSIGPPRDIGAATPTNLRWLRHPLRCRADRRARGRAQRWWLKPFRAGRKVWSGQAAKNSNERNWSAVPQKATDCRSLRVLQPWARTGSWGHVKRSIVFLQCVVSPRPTPSYNSRRCEIGVVNHYIRPGMRLVLT